MTSELAELRKISKILTLVNARVIENELSKFATTPERKKVWVLIDGNRTVDELMKYGGMKRRTVYDFLKILEVVEFIEFPRGKAPKKLLDFVPASWLNLVKIEGLIHEETVSEETDTNSVEIGQGDLIQWVK